MLWLDGHGDVPLDMLYEPAPGKIWMSKETVEQLKYDKGKFKAWNKYLDQTDCSDDVIFSARFGDDIYTFRRCEHGNRWMIHSFDDLHEHTDMATDCEECIKKGKPFRIVPPPHPLPKIGLDRHIEECESKEHIDEHFRLNWKSHKYLWGFDTTDEASVLQDIYFGD